MDIIMTAVREVWATLMDMAPYLLFGFVAAGVLSVFISAKTIERHLGGHGLWPIFKASLFGVPLPLCSCSVIPVAASLRRHGASRGATAAFLLSTPQTGVDSILATFSLLGPVFAVFRPVSAFITGLVGGGIIEVATRNEGVAGEVGTCEEACCAGNDGHSRFRRAMRYAFVVLPKDIAKPLLIGLVAAGCIAALIPAGFFAAQLGTGILAMLVMMAMGIPLYVCATASIPIAAAMMMKGITPGAALVFLMTGPATNVAAIAALWRVMGRRTAIVYLLVVAGAALASGLTLDLLFDVSGVTVGSLESWMPPLWFKRICAFVLLGVLAKAMIGSGHDHDHAAHDDNQGDDSTEACNCKQA